MRREPPRTLRERESCWEESLPGMVGGSTPWYICPGGYGSHTTPGIRVTYPPWVHRPPAHLCRPAAAVTGECWLTALAQRVTERTVSGERFTVLPPVSLLDFPFTRFTVGQEVTDQAALGWESDQCCANCLPPSSRFTVRHTFRTSQNQHFLHVMRESDGPTWGYCQPAHHPFHWPTEKKDGYFLIENKPGLGLKDRLFGNIPEWF